MKSSVEFPAQDFQLVGEAHTKVSFGMNPRFCVDSNNCRTWTVYNDDAIMEQKLARILQ